MVSRQTSMKAPWREGSAGELDRRCRICEVEVGIDTPPDANSFQTTKLISINQHARETMDPSLPIQYSIQLMLKYSSVFGWDGCICCKMDNSTKAKTFHRLKLQRLKEVQREGVLMSYHPRSYPLRRHFSFDPALTPRVQDMLAQKTYPLELCDDEAATVLKINPADLYLSHKLQDQGKLFVGGDIFYRRGRVEEGTYFYLAKANPTLHAYKDIYSHHQTEYRGQDFKESQHITRYLHGKAETAQGKVKIDMPKQEDLNQSQNDAIAKAGRNALTFIKGPPGCGKTKTIARLCRMFLERQMRVIVGAVSNTGNLSIVRELIREMEGYNTIAPLQHNYARLAETNPVGFYELLAQSYDHYIPYSIVFFPPFQVREEELPFNVRLYSFDTVVIKNMILVSADSGITTNYIVESYRRLKAREVVDNRFYAIFMQATIITLQQALIVVATTVKAKSLNKKLAPEYHYRPSVAILDEASQSSCSDTLCYLKLDVQKLILVGDDKQLNPTVISNDPLLKQSYFCNLAQQRPEYFTLLSQQYRMHPSISRISNTLFYQGMIADAVTHQQRVSPISPFSTYPVIFINSLHLEREGVEELGTGSKKTYCNPHEVYIIRAYLSHFPREEIAKVGIITPYVDQLKLLQREFSLQVKELGLTIRTCDGFQGGQRDYIFISLVRSNPEGNIGFCGEESRINVSITRACRGLMIVGNAHTFVASVNYWGAIAQYLHSQEAYFEFDLPITQQQIEAILTRNKDKIKPKRRRLDFQDYQYELDLPNNHFEVDYEDPYEQQNECWQMDEDDSR